MTGLTATLIAAASADRSAEAALKEWENRNLPEFINALAAELATEGKDIRARQLAGLYLKNILSAGDDQLQQQKHEQWKSLGADARGGVKRALLQAFRSVDSTARHTAAQATAEVAAIELPFREWPEFLPAMRENVSAETSDGTKIAALECLGFACERIAEMDHIPDIDEMVTNEMLTAIIDGIQPGRPEAIRLAAAGALKNSLLFASSNMERKVERDQIMNSISSATVSQDARVRVEAFICIAQIAFHYYDKLQEYMGHLFELTTNAIRSDLHEVAKEAIEFWSTICEAEMEFIDEENNLASQGLPVQTPCQRYVQAALEPFVPLLLETMTKHPDDALDFDREDAFTLDVAASTCLTLMAQTVEDAIARVVMPFVQQNIKSENWHFREAATMAFACILDGVSTKSIGFAVQQSIPVLLEALTDPNDLVEDTTAFTISKICESHSAAIPAETFPTLINGLVSKLGTENPRVARQACNALDRLGAAFKNDDTGAKTGTNQLSPFMPTLLQALMAVADRPDAMECNLRVTAFEAINTFVENAAPDCNELLLQLLPAAIERLGITFTLPVANNEAREAKEGLQGLLCSLLQVLAIKLERSAIAPFADAMMTNLLQALDTRSNTCHADAFSAISAIADTMEEDFEKYVRPLHPYLLAGLRQFEAYYICRIAVGLVADITSVVERKILPFTKEIMEALVDSLKDPALHRSVKPPVLACFGDIALAIEEAYEPYVQLSMMMLIQAAGMQLDQDDDDMVEYGNLLRDGVLEAFSGIINGLRGGSREDLFMQYVPPVVQFLQSLAADPSRDTAVLARAVGVIGDLASLGPGVKAHLNQQFISQLLQEGMQTNDPEIMQTAKWAGSLVQQLVQQ